MTIQDMMDNVIEKFGFEDEETVNFIRLVEEGCKFRIIIGNYRRLMQK